MNRHIGRLARPLSVAIAVLVLTSGALGAALVAGEASPAGANASRGAGQLHAVIDATLVVRPTVGPGGTRIAVSGSGFNPDSRCLIFLYFTDANGVRTLLETLPGQSPFRAHARIPNGASLGQGTLLATEGVFIDKACRPGLYNGTATFTVTP